MTDEKRKVYAECIKKTTALEKMKETQLAQYKEEQKRIEKKRIEQLRTSKIVNNEMQNRQ